MSTLIDKKLERLRRLEKRYAALMKQSFQTAIKDRKKSRSIKRKALELKAEIDSITEDMYAY